MGRKNLGEAMGRVEHLAGEREQLAEQYRSYSRDLASQAERLSVQLRKFQDENARLLHREAGLVQNVASLETQVQSYRKEGKNVTEEEICRLKDQILTYETEVRMTRDEKNKMQQMLVERGNQVDEMGQRLAMRDAKIMELQARASGLETTVEMMKSTSHSSDNDQAQLLAACQSDKVAASMAMQQNVKLKERLEELQGAVIGLTNSKAEFMNQLEDAKQSLSGFSSVEAKLSAMNEMVKEKDIMSNNLKNHVKYLEGELRDTNLVNNSDKHQVTMSNDNSEVKKEPEQSKESIRSLNSQISELQSKLEVLSSQTRDCSESRSSSRFSDGRTGMVDTDSDSCESYIEVESSKTTKDDSSESFIVLGSTDTIQRNVLSSQTENIVLKKETVTDESKSHCLDNIEALKQLEMRFISAMD